MDPDKLRAALAKQKIVVSADDPVLDVAAVCEVALEATVAKLRVDMEVSAAEAKAAVAQMLSEGKGAGSAIINQAADFVTERLRFTFAEMQASLLQEVRAETEKAETARHYATRAAWISSGAAAVVLAGGFGFWLAGL